MTHTRATKADLKEAFELFDTDGSGYIDETELAFALKSIGYSKVTKADIDFVMEDVGGEDRKINFKEFCTKVQSNNADAGGPQEIKLAFKMFDEEGSGAITYDNLARVAELVEGRPADEAFLKSVIKSADFDHDGALNYSEFEHAVTKYKRKQIPGRAPAPVRAFPRDAEEEEVDEY